MHLTMPNRRDRDRGDCARGRMQIIQLWPRWSGTRSTAHDVRPEVLDKFRRTGSHYGRIDTDPGRPDWLDACCDRLGDMSIVLSERTESQ
jgi:hypothetical protein